MSATNLHAEHDRREEMKPRLPILLTGIVLAVAAMGVLSAAAAPANRSSVPSALVAKWGKSMSLATWHKHHITYEPAGRWTIAISKKGVLSLYAPGIGFVTTSRILAVKRASVVFGPTADGFCAGNGSFKWKVSGRTLTLTLAKDDCDARWVLFTSGPWTRK
jgi:hypothetical protein